MAMFSARSPAAALEDILERERTALLAGEIGAMAGFAEKKARLLVRIASENLPPEGLQRLQRKCERNQHLLGAAARGIKAAKARICAINDPNPGLRTYGRTGTTTQLSGLSTGRINTRA